MSEPRATEARQKESDSFQPIQTHQNTAIERASERPALSHRPRGEGSDGRNDTELKSKENDMLLGEDIQENQFEWIESLPWWKRPPLWRNLVIINAIRCGAKALFGIPVLVLMWKTEKGLSAKEILWLQTIQSTLTIILEIPSGFISDMMDRKKILMVSAVASMMAYAIYSTTDVFGVIMIGQVLQGVANSLWSGTDVALLYETTRAIGGQSRSNALSRESNNMFTRQLTECIAAIIGGYISLYFGKSVAVFMNSVSFFFVLIGASLLSEPKVPKSEFEDKEAKDNSIWSSLRFLFSKRDFVRPVIVGAFMSASSYLNVWIQPMLWERNNVPTSLYGWYWSLINLSVSFAALGGPVLDKRFGLEWTYRILCIWCFLSLNLMSIIKGNAVVLTGCFLNFVRGVNAPLVSTSINIQVSNNQHRATILSIYSLIWQFVFSVIASIVGWVADGYGLEVACNTAAFILGGGGLLLHTILS